MNDTINAQGIASALWVLHHAYPRAEAEKWAHTAVTRGATQELAAEHLRQWDRENAPAVIGGGVA